MISMLNIGIQVLVPIYLRTTPRSIQKIPKTSNRYQLNTQKNHPPSRENSQNSGVAHQNRPLNLMQEKNESSQETHEDEEYSSQNTQKH